MCVCAWGDETVLADGAELYVRTGSPVMHDIITQLERAGMDVLVLDGPRGDGLEEMIAVGSIDGDDTIRLEEFLKIAERFEMGESPYTRMVPCGPKDPVPTLEESGDYHGIRVLAGRGRYWQIRRYVAARGYTPERPVRVKDLDDPKMRELGHRAARHPASRYHGNTDDWIVGFTGNIDLSTDY